jgi:hypothetical protein
VSAESDNIHAINWLLKREPGVNRLYKFPSCRDGRHHDVLVQGKIYIGEALKLNAPVRLEAQGVPAQGDRGRSECV